LTACVQLRRNRPHPCPNGKGRAPHRAMPPCRGVFNRVQGCSIWPLALPVPLRWIRRPNPGEVARAFPFAPASIKCDFPGPKCLPSTSAPEGARHRAHGLATGEPASSTLSPRECLRTSRLDHQRIHRFFTRGRDGHALLVNFCNRHDPRPQPLERTNPARGVYGVTHIHCAA
jgi:hypothetical protein